jgi:hypothetical protein
MRKILALNTRAKKYRRIRGVVFAILGATLVWQVTSGSMAAYLADAAPEAALIIRPSQPTALVNLADKMMLDLMGEEAKTPDARLPIASQSNADADPLPAQQADKIKRAFEAFEASKRRENSDGRQNPSAAGSQPSKNLGASAESSRRIRAWAEPALLAEPLNARALRILGQVADIAQDDARAFQLMQASVHLSLNEGLAVYWMANKSLERRDYPSTLYYADAFLRGSPNLISLVMPMLVQMAESKDGNDNVKKLLATNPPWRDRFFAVLPDSVTDARTPLDLLLATSDSTTGPSVVNIDNYLKFLTDHKLFELAYYAWLQFLPPEQLRTAGYIFNGSFETRPTGSPFDWVITPGAGVTIDILPRPGDKTQHALLLEFAHGRVNFQGIAQLIMLPPGSYRFNGKYTGEIVGQRGLKWRILCAGGSALQIGESKMITGVASNWRDIDFSFLVPDKDCRGQYVRLDLDARMASEQFVSGSIWFDEVGISRVADTAQKPNSDH